MAHLGPHSKVVGTKRGKERVSTGVGFVYIVVGGGGLEFHRFILYW